MQQHEFLARVRERGEYGDQAETERVTTTVLAMLGRRLAGGEGKDLAAQLPTELQEPLLAAPGEAEKMSAEAFVERLSSELGSTTESARWDASAVLSTVGEAVTAGELSDVLSQLDPDYAALFGAPGLTQG